jgi:hypothetical protein
MKKFLLFFLILNTYYLILATNIFASGKNIFGLHLTQLSDVQQAKNIINSSGGDWGYVTIVLPLNQMDKNAWQDFMDNCRQHHLIPIVRLATIVDQGNWKVPSPSDIDHLADFLSSLNWPSTPKHIVLFNEINHASEWGGQVNINQYTDLALYTIQKFKSIDTGFYIMGAGLDLAAPTKLPDYLSAPDTYRQIYSHNPDYFQKIDGLASHSYPNHGFVGKPTDTGQHSINGYLWELNFIKSLGVSKTYSIFITETGWPHREGIIKNNAYYSVATSAKFLEQALNIWSKDPQITAVTPFIFNYPNKPFDHFSWLDSSESLYPPYQGLISLSKTANTPIQINNYKIDNLLIPPILFPNINYRGKITLTNTGQSIWGAGETKFCLKSISSPNLSVTNLCVKDDLITPQKSTEIVFNFKIVDPKTHSFLQWENTTIYPIEAFYTNAKIYHPQYSPWQSLKMLFTRI